MTADFRQFYQSYQQRLVATLNDGPMAAVERMASALHSALLEKKQVFLAGNGGSAGNAIHLANDFLYGMGKDCGKGLRVEALSANPSVMTCLANDLSYVEIFAQQLCVKGQAGDVLIVLSGSGNSPNVVRALEVAHELGMQTFAVLGYSGGRCREIAQVPIYFAIDDMQIAEDLQLVVGHICMQWVRMQLNAAHGKQG